MKHNTKAEVVKDVRHRMKVSQEAFARLLGVHSLTISRWERGVVSPNPFLSALIDAFGMATKRKKNVGREAMEALALEGAPKAVYVLLKAAFALKG